LQRTRYRKKYRCPIGRRLQNDSKRPIRHERQTRLSLQPLRQTHQSRCLLFGMPAGHPAGYSQCQPHGKRQRALPRGQEKRKRKKEHRPQHPQNFAWKVTLKRVHFPEPSCIHLTPSYFKSRFRHGIGFLALTPYVVLKFSLVRYSSYCSS